MELRTAIRVAAKKAIDTIVGSFNVTVVIRPTRQPINLPAVTMYDTGAKIDDVVPLYDRKLHIDIWTASDLDNAEEIAHAVNSVFDHKTLALPNDEGLVAFLMLISDTDTHQNDTDVSRKSLTYRLLVYEYNGPEWGVLTQNIRPGAGVVVTSGQTPTIP